MSISKWPNVNEAITFNGYNPIYFTNCLGFFQPVLVALNLTIGGASWFYQQFHQSLYNLMRHCSLIKYEYNQIKTIRLARSDSYLVICQISYSIFTLFLVPKETHCHSKSSVR